MGCLAQIVNVLQAVILTEDDKMVLTPTYHVLHMYRFHQDADLLDSYLEGANETGVDGEKCKKVNESVSVDKDGVLTITLNNVSEAEDETVTIDFRDREVGAVEGIILNGKVDDYNSFEDPNKVQEKNFAVTECKGKEIELTLPACSLVTLRVTLK